MKTVVVPFDFSSISLNAAEYATRMLTGYYGITLYLYHAYKEPGDREEVITELNRLREHLRTIGIVKTEIMAGQSSDFIGSLEQVCLDTKADLVVMGITGKSGIEQKLIGSNTLKMMKRKVCPVLIIPAEASFKGVKTVLLASDMRDVENSTPESAIRKVLKTFHPKMHVMNVDEEHFVSITEEYRREMGKLTTMFSDFNPEFHFLDLHDTGEAISRFATDKQVDILILVHREQSFADKLFSKSHTEKMAYQSRIPLLAVHE